MINVTKVRTEELFVTRLFQLSPWIHELCRRQVTELWITDSKLPRGHFGGYFGAVENRKYDNKYIQDLYWLHEVEHRRTFGHNPHHPWHVWSRRMAVSEFDASIVSECMVYFHIPELRELTFPHEIWVDRFLRQLKDQWPIDEIERHIRAERMRAYTSPHPFDFFEHQIRAYNWGAEQWWGIWSEDVGYGKYANQPAFRVVENHMTSPDGDRNHQDWINDVTSPETGMPFAIQAELVSLEFERASKYFGNWLLLR